MKKINKHYLADISLEMTPLTEDNEGQLRGGFAGLNSEGLKAKINGNCECVNENGCTNTNTCNNDPCTNKPCGNDACSNTPCSNEGCGNITTTSRSKDMVFDTGMLI